MDKEALGLLGPALDSFLAEFADVAIAPTRKLIAAYLKGQLGQLPRKSVMPMARDAGIPPRTLQELLSLHRWDEDLLLETLQRHVWRARGGADAVATILETCCPKKGTRTPGVELQRCAPGGRTRNCVQLLHLGFANGEFNCLLDNAIYLPQTWTDSPERRSAARIPPAVKYRTKSEIALELLDRAAARGLRFGWVHVGVEDASDLPFLQSLEAKGYRYVAPRSALRDVERPFGSPGPWISSVHGAEEEEQVGRVARWGEQNLRILEQRRREIGLDHFEVRTYRSLLRHLALSAVSVLFLEERGGRLGTRPDRPVFMSRVLESGRGTATGDGARVF